MPRARKGGFADAAVGNGGRAKVGDSSDSSTVPGLTELPQVQVRLEATVLALQELLSRNDGWLRIVPQDDGKTVYYKWKYTKGVHKGYYVMYRDDERDPFKAFRALSTKVWDVDEGFRRPALDHPYNDD